MNLLRMVTAVNEWLASEKTEITVDAASCLHSRHKDSTCDRCIKACPVDALSLDGIIVLDAESCVQCGLCLHVCPVGAFSGDDGAADLLNAVSRLPQTQLVELACAAHPQAEKGPKQSSAVLRTKGCLAALGPASFLSLFVLDVAHLVVRLDACALCPLGKVQPEIERSVALACQIVADDGNVTERVTLISELHDEWPERKVTAVSHSTHSRREFFRSLTAVTEPPAIVKTLTAQIPTDEKQPPQERRRLLTALKLISAQKTLDLSSALLEALQFVEITADANCTACGNCERACPIAALQLIVVEDEKRFQLAFSTANCVDCGLCLAYCEPNALTRHTPTSLTKIIDETLDVIQQGDLQKCSRCGAGFAGNSDDGLCSVCSFRSKQPFGSRLVSPN